MDTKILSKITKEAETRTTCILTHEGVAALESLSNEFKYKHKMIFNLLFKEKWLFDAVISKAGNETTSNKIRNMRKCLVISKKNLTTLNDAAKQAGLSRDMIIDAAFIHILDTLRKITAMQKEHYKRAETALKKLSEEAWAIEKGFEDYLNEDDPIRSRFGKVIVILDNLIIDINECIENDVQIDYDKM